MLRVASSEKASPYPTPAGAQWSQCQGEAGEVHRHPGRFSDPRPSIEVSDCQHFVFHHNSTALALPGQKFCLPHIYGQFLHLLLPPAAYSCSDIQAMDSLQGGPDAPSCPQGSWRPWQHLSPGPALGGGLWARDPQWGRGSLPAFQLWPSAESGRVSAPHTPKPREEAPPTQPGPALRLPTLRNPHWPHQAKLPSATSPLAREERGGGGKLLGVTLWSSAGLPESSPMASLLCLC